MTNQEKNQNEAPKTPAPGQSQPAPQQNQGGGKSGSEKPEQQK
jgi:hypothetical protein